MPIKYFKPDVMIATRCEHCGADQHVKLEKLYSDETLICISCGQEHTAQRDEFRRKLDETEALLDTLPDWPWLEEKLK